MKKEIRAALFLLAISASHYSCSFAPVNNQFEKAGTLKKGNLEFAGSYTGYGVIGEGGGSTNHNFGFRAGYGISDKFDLKLRYERLIPSNLEFDEFSGSSNINYFSLVPKIAIVPDKFSIMIPLSIYIDKEEFESYKSSFNYYSVAPQFLYTFTNSKRKFDFTVGAKGDFWFAGEGGVVLILGTTAGAGFSSDLRKWAIRPELGLSLVEGGFFYSYGVGLQLMIPAGKK